LQRLQRRYGDAIDRAVEDRIAQAGEAQGFIGMMRYQLGYVNADLEPSASGLGKRFRPVLCLLACEAVGTDWRDALPAAGSIELLHNFSLIHDDIEDQDPARRHRPTVWKVWGEPQAINAGDGMFALAALSMLDATRDAATARRISERFYQVALSLTEGQYLDMSFETRHDVTPEEYVAMIERKTAALIDFSLWCGATVAGASEMTVEALSNFGRDLGKAFQIRDDIQGIWGSPSTTGKEAAKDLRNRKKTLPVLMAIERATKGQQRLLNDFFQGSTRDVGPVIRVMEETAVERLAQQQANRLVEAAMQSLNRAHITQQARQELAALATELVGQDDRSSTGTVTNV
jgi:geranylgeranyl diphosphate synthase type I